MPDEFLYIEFAEACDGDKSKILAAAAEALTHINAHAEAAQVQQVLKESAREAAQVEASSDVAFGGGQQ
jgi:hypothetical protein